MQLNKEECRLVSVALSQYLNKTSHVVFTAREEAVLREVAEKLRQK